MKKLHLSLFVFIMSFFVFNPVSVFAQEGTLRQTMYIDFGKSNVDDGNITVISDDNPNYWNNALETAFGSKLNLKNSKEGDTGYELEITKGFSANGIRNGGLTTSDKNLLGDLAVNTATQDYFYIEGSTGNGSFKIKNLNPNLAYRFHVFGSRSDNNARIGYLSFTGATGSHGTHQMGGAGIGAKGENQNTSNIFVTDWIFPNHRGEIDFIMTIQTGGFAHINAMKIEEYGGVNPLYVADRYYIDFGRNNGEDAVKTDNPDVNGRYWNNAFVQDGITLQKGLKLKLVNSENVQSEMEIETISNFHSNGIRNGGLLQPDASLLKDLAIPTATQDYIFIEGGTAYDPGCIDFKNLDPNKGYRFHVFGSREDSGDTHRIGLFTFTGENASKGSHRMGGKNSGGEGIHQNIGNVYVSDVIYPDVEGKIRFDIVRYSSNFSHVNAMKIEECTNDPIIRATSIKLLGKDITEFGQALQIETQVLPAGFNYGTINWSVDDTSLATITDEGLLRPKKNGKVKVTATIDYGDTIVKGELEVNISGQLAVVYFAGSAVEEEEDVEMYMITDLEGSLTSEFEIYTSLKGSGSFYFYVEDGLGGVKEYGIGGEPGKLSENGSRIEIAVKGPVRISADLVKKTYEIVSISSLNVVGSSVPTGTDVAKGSPLSYEGKGVWGGYVVFNSGEGKSFNFIVNRDSKQCFKRIEGTRQVVMQSQGSLYGIPMADIPTNMNGGEYYVEIDLRNYTYRQDCGGTNEYQISYMGSSVATGAGALNSYGWTHMHNDLLRQRHADGLGLDWKTSNISIGGHTTSALLNRFERDLLTDCSQYVIYALSFGNEKNEKGSNEAAYNSFYNGMNQLVDQAREAGIIPVISNNYTRSDYKEEEYNYVKQLNLWIHEWDVPSINTLGAIDDGAGRWAKGYRNDDFHQNTAGHQEFFYAAVPSLFDALAAGKPQPVRVSGTSYMLGRAVTSNRIEFTPEHIVHPFTLSFDMKTTGKGTVAWFENERGNGFLRIDSEGKLVYESPLKGTIRTQSSVATGDWKRVTLTHYYAWGVTILYVDNEKAGEIYEKLVPQKFALSGVDAPEEVEYRELFFWRAGMNKEEIEYVNNGKMMKSSLEIYAPLGGEDPLVNLAQSTNTLQLENSGLILDQKVYIDFGKDHEDHGHPTTRESDPINHWNNAIETASGTVYDLVNSMEVATGYRMELISGFYSNGKSHGALLEPSTELLGDLAIHTATHDYFYVEKGKDHETGIIEFKDLNPEKSYKFHIFGSRHEKQERTGLITLSGTNSHQGTHQMSGEGIGAGDVEGNEKNQNNSEIFTTEPIHPDANGVIRLELAIHAGNFAYINAMKIEEYSPVYVEGVNPVISITPEDGLGIRAARLHSSSGALNTNEGAENLLLDGNIDKNKTKKWCNASGNNWVIIELSDFYDIERFEIDDCKAYEPDNANVPEYYIYVSTTGTEDGDWVEVVHEINQSDVMYKVKEVDPVKARYVKFVPVLNGTIRIYKFRMYGKKSFESIYTDGLISVGKPVIDQQDSPVAHQSVLTLFDGNMETDNSKWSTFGGNKYVVVDLEDNYEISEFKLYDAGTTGDNSLNIDGYQISISSDLSNWEEVVNATGRSGENEKVDVVSPARAARYVKLEIPEDRMGSQKKIELYEFNIFGQLITSEDDATLFTLDVSLGNLYPSFDPARASYFVEVAKEVENITIQATARNENATIEGEGEKALSIGENNFMLTVTAEDGVTTNAYYITVNRAEKSSITGITSLSVSNVELTPAFSSSTYEYRGEIVGNKVTVNAELVSPYSTITGIGEQTLNDGANYITVTVTSEDGKNSEKYNITVYNTDNLISVSSPDGIGKRIVNVDSYSGKMGNDENPFRLLRGWRDNLSGNTKMKWCDGSEAPYVIFSLADIYTINRIEFRDCKMIEPGFGNVPQYSVYVSTTDTEEDSWIEIVNEQRVGDLNEKVKSFDPVDARFVKFVPTKGDNVIRIYGFDIYGKFKETIDRDELVSVGKTVMSSSFTLTSTSNEDNDQFSPANLLDGRMGTAWEFDRKNAFVEIDLEDTYDLGRFVVIDSANWINGYKVSVSNNGSDWKEVAEPGFDDIRVIRKEVLLNTAEKARYVRLDIPQTNQFARVRLRGFEVYKYVEGQGLENIYDSFEGLVIYPNPVSKGESLYLNQTGLAKIYSLGGALVYQQEIVEGGSLSTSNLEPGSYIIQMVNENKVVKARLIVK